MLCWLTLYLAAVISLRRLGTEDVDSEVSSFSRWLVRARTLSIDMISLYAIIALL